MRRAHTPCASQVARSSSRAPGSPARTTEAGLLTAATDRRLPKGAMRSPTRSAETPTEAMPPRPERPRTARLRRATTFAPSSRESAPATHAAAISPWEWPTTAAGVTPWDSHSAASDTITAHRTGWTTSTRSSQSSCGERRTSLNRQSTWGASAVSHSAIRSANTGDSSSRSAVMPSHWEPWPGKTRTGRPWGRAVPVTRPGAGSAAASAPRLSTRSVRSAVSRTARWLWRERVESSEWARSGRRRSGRSVRNRASRAAWACRAWPVCPERRTGRGRVPVSSSSVVPGRALAVPVPVPVPAPIPVPAPPPAPASVSASASASASATTTWQLVPPMPKELTPATRGPAVSSGAWGQGVRSVGTLRRRW
ncbi:hypothetical protein SFUMM280S_01037 [Streptomyces fumanus]